MKERYEDCAKKAEQNQAIVEAAKSQNKSPADVAKMVARAQVCSSDPSTMWS
jgi:hypothetical protein